MAFRSLADVAGPVVRQQRLSAPRRKMPTAGRRARRRRRRESPRSSSRMSSGRSRSGRERDLRGVQAVVEIGPEAARARTSAPRSPLVAVIQRRSTAKGSALRAAGSPVLHDPEQLGLRWEAQLSHLVQEDGAAVRGLEPARRSPGGPGRAPRSSPKSSLSNKESGIAGAAHRHEGRRGARRSTDAAISPRAPCRYRSPGDQHARGGGGEPVDEAARPPDRLTLSEEEWVVNVGRGRDEADPRLARARGGGQAS